MEPGLEVTSKDSQVGIFKSFVSSEYRFGHIRAQTGERQEAPRVYNCRGCITGVLAPWTLQGAALSFPGP